MEGHAYLGAVALAKVARGRVGNRAAAMKLFAMISTKHSVACTEHAIESFFATTPMEAGDLFYLIDNDGSLPGGLAGRWEGVRTILNKQPLSFAGNGNTALELCRENKADLFLLNNDIIFSRAWLDPLMLDLPVLMSPISNQHVQYSLGDLSLRPCMDLEEYLPRADEFRKIVHAHSQKKRGCRKVLSIPFFCVKIPRAVYEAVGLFDTSFGQGGAEDNDYCLRAYLQGFAVFLALDSLILHFQGKSTWRGGESEEETRARNTQYMEAFSRKWGERLRQIMIFQDPVSSGLNNDEEALLKEQRIAPFLRLVSENEGRQERAVAAKPRTAAVCCVYDDVRWLEPSAASVYDSVDRIFFLISDTPWHGNKGSNSTAVEAVKNLPDPEGKLGLIEGSWASETEQRNSGLQMLRDEGFEYCFVLDADEVYDRGGLKRLFEFAFEERYVPAWRIRMWTYWKTKEFRVDPPEPYQPVVLVRADCTQFTDKREITPNPSRNIPENICMMHHLSYARSNEEVLRKITTFSHVDQVVSGWYENVWKGWDRNPELQNLHPCWPECYRSVRRVSEEELPEVLRSVRS